MIRRADRITTLVILAITVLYVARAFHFPGSAKIVPAVFGGAALLVVLTQLVAPRIAVLRPFAGELEIEDEKDRAVFGEGAARRRLVQVSASLLLVPVVIAIFGLPLALPLYVAAFLALQRPSLLTFVLGTAAISAASYGLLMKLLSWPWDVGLIWQLV
jgi:hypothetical protein